ncbi:MAG: phosphate ABC transporter substrate-binding protein PstS [Sulfurimonas sp. CG08_land_8_20_14_0_20_36_33]|nr:phosphate ABC transporter substrate-binding protein PstS [Campylobacterota bacterium]OIO16193.1 MAG: phosphate ABC transporter substrate-binding protein PstS [Helicobacteraceae bacterium CG1_02_36_14]PIP09344.1 MAG: phosphate ABC transporter substrate-binding protein PstS [Sulfurimonas sp. CG23_combo_of_CG06-09_8_20_14_all_36_33]PIS24397.1 MAG: phosphate ABC transporter substrate-binding protein PstS [Sulfurimonas sp. CG08_land_8_20_14_0_20_36_33]PIV03113.1 MAG: phosphate ABC transporter sub
MFKRIASAALIAAVTLTSSFAEDKINGAGASFPAPVYYDWAYNYKADTKNSVNYQSIGSGGGIKQITKRVVDFGATDAALTTLKLAKANLFQFPAVIGSIVVAFNVEGIADETLKLTNAQVADIFAGKITMWNDPAIVANNQGVQLPNQKIVVVHRSDGSGTTFNFTYYLSESSENWKNNYGAGKAIDWATGIGGKGNEGVSNIVKQTPYSIGYIENAYKEKNNLSAAVLQTASGKWVKATEDNFKAAAKYATWTKKQHFYSVLALQAGDTSYPIVAATFILLPREGGEMNKKVIAFYDYAFKNGDESAKKLGYIPLPEETKKMIREYWATNIQ